VEGRALPDKTAAEVSRFLYEEIICRHSALETIISDQGREFNNAVNDELFRLTGVRHRVCRPYHPQANGLIERLNQTIKRAILKTIGEETEQWPLVIPGVLFAYRVVVQRSTNFSPFFLMYQRHPILPSDLKGQDDNLENEEDIDGDLAERSDEELIVESEEFDSEMFADILQATLRLKSVVEDAVMDNIKKAQEQQKMTYNKKHMTGVDFYVGQKVLVINKRREERKGGKVTNFPRSGPYEIVELNATKGAVLRNEKGKILKTVVPTKHLYPFLTAEDLTGWH